MKVTASISNSFALYLKNPLILLYIGKICRYCMQNNFAVIMTFSAADEETVAAYKEAQDSVDEALRPKKPAVFELPK